MAVLKPPQKMMPPSPPTMRSAPSEYRLGVENAFQMRLMMLSSFTGARRGALLGRQDGLNRRLQLRVGGGNLGMPFAFLELVHQHRLGVLVVLVLGGDVLVGRTDLLLVEF